MNGYLALVLVTGSRSFDDVQAIHRTLEETWYDARQDGWAGIKVVEGGAEGPDKIAGAWARARQADGIDSLTVNAAWEAPCVDSCQPGHRRTAHGATYCPTAGHRRNADMVDLRPEVALAFIDECHSARCKKPKPHDSHGVANCIGLAKKAGIPVVEVRAA